MFLFLLKSKDTNQGEGRAANNLQTARLWQRRADRKKTMCCRKTEAAENSTKKR